MKKFCQADADDRTTLRSEQRRHYRQQNFWAENVCRTGAGSCVVVYVSRVKSLRVKKK
ncbi:hypothetical protein SAMN05518863_104293 [Candidatus Pantoea symbiotica]|uniref:Uncharacterized protein n=1 Tax=Candidatus Pantoea symbiotica TaxID=1884370 RepID=A0A1I3WLK5_9GAMM|nr:hypothetical protein [Enterobacter sp. Sphag1F]NYI12589.1 hypothetical protein [Enterobacter sp. Sphag71]SFK08352.1 hypothetical protein SAMN05518863_104293 [Pantoea symbiotica]SFU74161.1 hypothetical protein SAMN05518864_104293 [Pantoea sp. YR525]